MIQVQTDYVMVLVSSQLQPFSRSYARGNFLDAVETAAYNGCNVLLQDSHGFDVGYVTPEGEFKGL